MKRRPKEPSVPFERKETIRRNVISLLEENTLSARKISVDVRISERDVYEHLEHIQRSVLQNGDSFIVHPPECRKCGFVFRKRESEPGRCPGAGMKQSPNLSFLSGQISSFFILLLLSSFFPLLRIWPSFLPLSVPRYRIGPLVPFPTAVS